MGIMSEYSDYILDKKETTNSKKILFEIVSDLTGRRGLRQEWEGIDDDIQEEIMDEWLEIIEKYIFVNGKQ